MLICLAKIVFKWELFYIKGWSIHSQRYFRHVRIVILNSNWEWQVLHQLDIINTNAVINIRKKSILNMMIFAF